MRTVYLLLRIVACALMLPTANARAAGTAASTWRTVERVTFGWNGEPSQYTFTIEADPHADAIDSPRLRITAPSGAALTVSADGGLVPLSDGVWNKSLSRDNLLHSRFLYLTPKIKGANGSPVLLVFGWPFASDPGSVRVVVLDDAGVPNVAFSDNRFLLKAITDLDGDGVPELIGKRSLTQSFGKCFETYDPFVVYRFAEKKLGSAGTSLALSKAYNLKHYVGWAGPTPREDLAVARCPNVRPQVMDAKRAEELYGH